MGYVKGKPDPAWWISQIRQGIAFRKKFARENKWDTWRNYYRGNWVSGTLPVNLFFRMMRTTVPRIYFRNPSISVTANKPGPEQQAFSQLIERIDNKLIRTMQVKQQIKRIVQNCFMFGTGIGKLGFGAQFTPTPDLGETINPHSGDEIFEYNMNIRDNMPWFLSVHPGHFIVPAGLMNYEDTRWVANWIQRPLHDVQSDPRLKHTANLKASAERVTGAQNQPMLQGGDKPDMVDLVEIRDAKFKKVILLAPFATDKVLLEDDDEMQLNGRLSYYPAVFNDDDEVFWGVADSQILEPQQLELNEIRTLEMKHRRLSIAKILAKRNSLKQEEIERLLSEDVLAVVQVDGELSDIETRMVSEIPMALRQAGVEVMNDVRENLGFSRNQSGNFSESGGRHSATEAQIVAQAAEIRVDERKDMIADILVNMFEDLHKVIFDKWNEEQVVSISGPNGLPVWVAFKPAMLKAASYDLNIDPDTAMPMTQAARTERANGVYNVLKDNPLIDPEQLTKYYLHELHGVQFDNMMRSLGQTFGQGQGQNPDQPLSTEQYVQMLSQNQQQKGSGTGA
jgi:hypothetical protein